MLPELDNWLKSSRNYLVGIALYERYGSNSVLKGLFKGQPNAWLEKKLLTELQSIRDKMEVLKPPQKPKLNVAHQKAVEHFKIKFVADQPIIATLTKKKGELYREMISLHSHLYHMNEEECAKAAFIIISNDKEIKRIWQLLDNYESTGIIPANLTGKLTLKELMQKLKNLPTYITKLNQKLEKLEDGPEKDKANLQLAAYEAELLTLNQIVENDTTIITKA
jgi:hypothetical protein